MICNVCEVNHLKAGTRLGNLFSVCGTMHYSLLSLVCSILRGPGRECILDVVPRGTELGTQVKMGSRAGRTHSQ